MAYWADKERDDEGAALPDKGPTFLGGGAARSTDSDPTPVVGPRGVRIAPPTPAEDCFLPGNVAADYRPLNAGKLIPAGSDIAFNLHYTPNGTAVTDHVKVGFTVLATPPERRYLSFLTSSPTDPKLFAIPPNDPNWESPPAEVTFLQDAELVYLMPHMHARGKDMTYTLEYPDGRKQIVLSVLATTSTGSSATTRQSRSRRDPSCTSTRISTIRRATAPTRIRTRPCITGR